MNLFPRIFYTLNERTASSRVDERSFVRYLINVNITNFYILSNYGLICRIKFFIGISRIRR
jgi:hypothetical protein